MKDVTQIDPVALRTLATAVRLGTFEATARELHVTPSAVSQRIKALETHVGRVLVHRVKPLEATEAGQVLVRLAAQTELLEREAVAELLEGEDPGEDDPFAAVPIAVNADALYTWLIDALVAVQGDAPGDLRDRARGPVAHDRAAAARRRDGRGDVRPAAVPGCRVVRLGSMRYCAVATPAWVEAHLPDGATSAALGRVPMIAFDRNDTQQHDFLRKVTRRHLTPPVTWIPSVGEFDNAVRRGMGWGMIPEVQVRRDLDRGRLVEIVPGRHTDVPLYWQHWRLESPLMADLTAAVATAARRWLS